MATIYKDALNNTVSYRDIPLSDGSKLPQSAPTDAIGNVLFSDSNPGVVQPKSGVSITQVFVSTVVFNSSDTTGLSGSNGTIIQVLPANPNRKFLEIINNGSADCELWFNSKPANADVNASPVKKGIVVQSGSGRIYDIRVPTNAIYVTTTAVGGLSVLEA